MPPLFLDDRRLLARVCLGTALFAAGFGMMAPVSSLWLQDTGHSPTLIGLNTACYYLGTVLATGLVPPLMRRRGRRCIVAGLLGVAVSAAAFPWFRGTAALFALRGVNGLATAFSLVPLEALHSTHSQPAWRARILGLYALMVAIGAAAGMSVGTLLYEAGPARAFLVSGVTTAVAACLFQTALPADLTLTALAGGTEAVRPWCHPLSMSCAWCEGFLEGVLFYLLPVYLRGVGYLEKTAGMMGSLAVLGGIAAQVPLAWLADRIGHRRVVGACLIAVAAGLWLMPLWPRSASFGGLLMLVGAGGTALYPLGLAVLSHRVLPAGRARAGAWFLAVNCLGSVAGPAVTGVAMDRLGANTALWIAAAMITLIALIAVGQPLVNGRSTAAVPTVIRQATRRAA